MQEAKGHIWLTREDARARVLEASRFSPRVERIAVAQSVGRVCAADVASRQSLPNAPSSRWDGVAVRYDDFAAGMPDTSGWREGREYAFSNTGIGIRGDYDTVVRIEEVSFDAEGRISFAAAPAQRGALVMPVGATLEEGEPLARTGQTITPELAALLAGGGWAEVDVYARPRVAFIRSGNELVDAGRELPLGKNVETNSLMAAAKLRAWGAEPLVRPIVADDVGLLVEALCEAVEDCDIVILNGGSSKGTDDCAVPAIERVARVLCHAVLMGPGAHTSLSVTSEGVPVIGLSGPSGGAECTIDWYVKPLVDRYFGLGFNEPPKVRARLLAALDLSQRSSGSKVKMAVRCLLARSSDGFVAAPMGVLPESLRLQYRGGNAFVFASGVGFALGEEAEAELRYPYAFPPRAEGLFDDLESHALVL